MEVSHPGCNIDAAATAEVCEDWEVGWWEGVHVHMCVWGGGGERGGRGGREGEYQGSRGHGSSDKHVDMDITTGVSGGASARVSLSL